MQRSSIRLSALDVFSICCLSLLVSLAGCGGEGGSSDNIDRTSFDSDWVTQAGGSYDEAVYATEVDAEGNIYIAGRFSSERIDFGGESVVDGQEFVTKLSASGNQQWLTSFGTAAIGAATSLAVHDGRIYLAGNTNSSEISFGGETASVEDADGIGFVTALDGSGTPVWARGFEMGSAARQDNTNPVVTADSGGVYIAGAFSSETTLGGETLTNDGTEGADIFVARWNADGSHAWSKAAGSDRNDTPHTIAVDDESNIYLGGIFQDDILDFGDGTLEDERGGAFVASLDSSGGYRWGKASDSGQIRDVEVSSSGRIYAFGDFQGATANFGGSTLENPASSVADMGARIDSLVVAAFDRSGEHRWSQTMGGEWDDVAGDLELDSRGRPYLAGSFESKEFAIGDETLSGPGAPEGASDESDVFVAALTADGSLRGTDHFARDSITASSRVVRMGLGPDGRTTIVSNFNVAVELNGTTYETENAGIASPTHDLLVTSWLQP